MGKKLARCISTNEVGMVVEACNLRYEGNIDRIVVEGLLWAKT
jgi:hypothetical protein